jgi:CO/xanthine dehydrogenase Mo-binding subunit
MKKRGRGVAGCIYSATVPTAPNPCGANAQMREDGSVVIQIGACDIGQGSNTVLAQIASEVLGVPFEQISVYSADTGVTPYDFGTLSSRLTFTGGNAVMRACEEVKKVLFNSVSKKLGVSTEQLVVGAGRIYDRDAPDDPDKSVSIAEAAVLSYFVFRELPMGSGYYYPVNTPVDQDLQGCPIGSFSYHATIAEVEVDTETGEVDVLDLYVAVDCGQAVNPMLVEGQLDGGAVMGMGWALREDTYPGLAMVEGLDPEFTPEFRADNFADYPIATAKDLPTIHTAIVEQAQVEGPFGAKAAGEIVMNSVAPAIVNAIYDAVGVRIFDLPASPQKVLQALKAQAQAVAS